MKWLLVPGVLAVLKHEWSLNCSCRFTFTCTAPAVELLLLSWTCRARKSRTPLSSYYCKFIIGDIYTENWELLLFPSNIKTHKSCMHVHVCKLLVLQFKRDIIKNNDESFLNTIWDITDYQDYTYDTVNNFIQTICKFNTC